MIEDESEPLNPAPAPEVPESEVEESEPRAKSPWKAFVLTGLLAALIGACLLYTSPSPRDQRGSRMPSSA